MYEWWIEKSLEQYVIYRRLDMCFFVMYISHGWRLFIWAVWGLNCTACFYNHAGKSELWMNFLYFNELYFILCCFVFWPLFWHHWMFWFWMVDLQWEEMTQIIIHCLQEADHRLVCFVSCYISHVEYDSKTSLSLRGCGQLITSHIQPL